MHFFINPVSLNFFQDFCSVDGFLPVSQDCDGINLKIQTHTNILIPFIDFGSWGGKVYVFDLFDLPV